MVLRGKASRKLPRVEASPGSRRARRTESQGRGDVSMKDMDVATVLSQLPTAGATDTITKVLEIHDRVMRVYEPVERNYRAAAGVISSNTTTPRASKT